MSPITRVWIFSTIAAMGISSGSWQCHCKCSPVWDLQQRIPESSRARKETVDIGILVTYRNGDRKIMQSEKRVDLPQEKGSGTS